MNRRDFFKTAAIATTAPPLDSAEKMAPGSTPPVLPDLAPARWLWYPSGRTLPNTFVLFRREFELNSAPVSAKGWIGADSRYLLEANGERVQWGPAPCDPRWLELDPVDLSHMLHQGRNALGTQVLFYGHGDGTWPAGKPGFFFHLVVDCSDGSRQTIVSDASWSSMLARAWQPGHYKRWSCVLCRKSSMPGCFPMAGARRAS